MWDASWHSLPIEQIKKVLNVSDKGLEEKDAKERLEKYGLNEIAEAEKISLLEMFLTQFKDIMVIILLFAVTISLIVAQRRGESPIEAIVIGIIVIFNAIFGFAQEYRSEKALEALKQLAAHKATVMRDGEVQEIFARELVPGDIVLLEVGDFIPADIRVMESVNLQVDEAVLTGESIPVWKRTPECLEPTTPIAEQENMVFLGTLVTFGRGQGIVVETGMRTQFGKIAGMIQEAEKKETPLQRKLQDFGKQIAGIILVLAILVFLAELYRASSYTFDFIIDMLIVAIALAVAAIPEGLPAVVTIALALGVQRMVKRHSIMRRLPAVETLGSTTVICSDKTGTMTKNEMTVRKIYINRDELEVTGSGYERTGTFLQKGKVINPKSDKNLIRLLEIGTLCNNAIFQEEEQSIVGDPTEGALLIVTEKAGISREELQKQNPIIAELSFDSARKRMTTIHQTPLGKKVAYVKGAPEVLLDLSTLVVENNKERKMTPEDKVTFLECNKQFASEALRVLAFAYKVLPDEQTEYIPETVETELVFVGLAGMIDPPREAVPEAIQVAQNAGITVKMITGDQPLTAKAVAREVGLASEEDVVITGRDLSAMDDETLDDRLSNAVYARVAPEHKVRLVQRLKNQGHIVAMTGDGVNDAPAMKHADIGIAMGIRGTDITKEASDMILADDNFATIVAAVEEGRAIFSNIKKFIRYLLAANTSEVLIIFITAMLGLKAVEHGIAVTVLPLTAIQILWINLITDGFPALALGVDPEDPDIMKRPPRDPNEKILENDTLLFILVFGILATLATLAIFLWQLEFDFSTFRINSKKVSQAKTAAFTTLVVFELMFVFNARSETHSIFGKQLINNKYLIIAVLLSLSLQLAVVYIPALQAPFETVPLNLQDWVVIMILCSPSLLIPPKLFLKPKYYKK
ncbi:MAG: calcium-translocating P-type ATPase, SERCA-type [Candidatus Heimdallarchaeota archaeon]